MKKSILLSIIIYTLAIRNIAAQIPYLVKDINPGTPWSSPNYLSKSSEGIYFEAITNLGWGLWKSDGTSQGTIQLKNFGPNNEIYNITDINGTVYFRANDGQNGYEIWKSDGTPAGTQLLKDIYPGAGGSYPSEFIYFQNKIFFVAGDNLNGAALWTTDGTPGGTVMFKDLNPGALSGGAYNLTIMGNYMYFWANSVAQTYVELWKSDGTALGTEMVKAFNGVTTPKIQVSNGKLFFAYGGGATGKQGVWVSDGTTAGTQLLKDFNVSLGNGILEDRMVDVNGTLFLAGDDKINGKELWKTDGTPAGTVMVKNIQSGITSGGPTSLTSFKGLLYFVAVDDKSTTELWKSDGTDSGTVQIEKPYSGSTHPTDLYVYNNTLFFNASQWTGNAGIELWKCDGINTSMVYDIYAGSNHSSTAHHVGVKNKLFFRAQDAANGVELWALDVPPAANGFISPSRDILTIYPNPVVDYLYIPTLQFQSCRFQIFDASGSMVKESLVNDSKIELPDLEPGIYVIRMYNTEGFPTSRKFIKSGN